MARPLPPPMPPRPPRPDRLQILARKVERLRNALGAFGAVLTGEAWEKGTHVQRYGLAGEEVVVYLDGRSVEIEGPTDLVRRIVAAADRVDG